MGVETEDFASWLAQAQIPQKRLTPEVLTLLQALFRFRQQQGSDYFSTRLLSHFLLHCHSGLKVAHIARLLGICRPTASAQQGLSSKQVIQQAHHRLDGRPYGKLLPRFAGPIAGFLLRQPAASRAALIDFVEATFGVRVSRIAVYKFLKKYGLDRIHDIPAAAPPHTPPVDSLSPAAPAPLSGQSQPAEVAGLAGADLPGHVLLPEPTLPLVPPAPPFSTGGRNTPAPSC